MKNLGNKAAQWIPLAALVAAIVAHAIYFDHWGDSVAKVWLGLNQGLAALGWTWYGLGACGVGGAVGLPLYLAICRAPRRFYRVYAVLLLIAQAWCLLNPALIVSRIQHQPASLFSVLAIAMTLAGYAGLAQLVLLEFFDVGSPYQFEIQCVGHFMAAGSLLLFFVWWPTVFTVAAGEERGKRLATFAVFSIIHFVVQAVCFWSYKGQQESRLGALSSAATGQEDV